MKYQVTILLFAGLVAYTSAAPITAGAPASTLVVKNSANADIPASGIYVGEVIKLTCSVPAGTTGMAKAKYMRGTAMIANPVATGETITHDYTLEAADVGDATAYTCLFQNGDTPPLESAASTPAQTAKVLAATTTAAPTTTAMGGAGGGSGSGAGSNSPVMAIFLLSIAAMCF